MYIFSLLCRSPNALFEFEKLGWMDRLMDYAAPDSQLVKII